MFFLDIVLLVPILFGAYIGFRKGLIIEVCTLLAFGLGIYAGTKFSGMLCEYYTTAAGETPKYLPLIAFSVCFLAVVILVFFIGKWLERFVKLSLLKPIDKILGAVFGFIKMTLIIAVLLIIFDAYNQRKQILTEEQKNNSLLYKPLTDLAMNIIPALDKSGIVLTVIQLNELQMEIEEKVPEENP